MFMIEPVFSFHEELSSMHLMKSKRKLMNIHVA